MAKTETGFAIADIFKALTAAEKDFRAGLAKITEARAQLAATTGSVLRGRPARINCPHCGASLKGPRTLAEHIFNIHDGPEPAHWLEAEEKAET